MRLTHDQYVDGLRADGECLAAVAGRGLDVSAPARPWPPERDDTPAVEYLRTAHDALLADALTVEGDAAVVALLRERLRAATQ